MGIILGDPLADLSWAAPANADTQHGIPAGVDLNGAHPELSLDVSSWDGILVTVFFDGVFPNAQLNWQFQWTSSPTRKFRPVGASYDFLNPINVVGGSAGTWNEKVKRQAGPTTYYLKNRGPYFNLVAFLTGTVATSTNARITITPTNQSYPHAGPYTPTPGLLVVSSGQAAIPAGGVTVFTPGTDYTGPVDAKLIGYTTGNFYLNWDSAPGLAGMNVLGSSTAPAIVTDFFWADSAQLNLQTVRVNGPVGGVYDVEIVASD